MLGVRISVSAFVLSAMGLSAGPVLAAAPDAPRPAAAVAAVAAVEPSAPLPQALADAMVQRCVGQSAAKSWPAFSIAIVDTSGSLILLRRQDPASGLTADVAALKAKSAARAGAPTQQLAKMGEDPPTRDLFLLLQLTDEPGGVPIQINGRLVGAIGVSGGTVDQDIGCATAALTALPAEKK